MPSDNETSDVGESTLIYFYKKSIKYDFITLCYLIQCSHIFDKHPLCFSPLVATVDIEINALQSLVSTSNGASRNTSVINCALYCYSLSSNYNNNEPRTNQTTKTTDNVLNHGCEPL